MLVPADSPKKRNTTSRGLFHDGDPAGHGVRIDASRSVVWRELTNVSAHSGTNQLPLTRWVYAALASLAGRRRHGKEVARERRRTPLRPAVAGLSRRRKPRNVRGNWSLSLHSSSCQKVCKWDQAAILSETTRNPSSYCTPAATVASSCGERSLRKRRSATRRIFQIRALALSTRL